MRLSIIVLLMMASTSILAEATTTPCEKEVLRPPSDARKDSWAFSPVFIPEMRKKLVHNLQQCWSAPASLIKDVQDHCKHNFNDLRSDKKADLELTNTCINEMVIAMEWRINQLDGNNAEQKAEQQALEDRIILVSSSVTKQLAEFAPKTRQEEIEALQKENALAKITSDDTTWYPGLYFGTRMMPEYDDAGNNQGFRESNMTGRFVLDSRKEYESAPKGDNKGTWNAGHNLGVELELMSESIVNCEEFAENDPNFDQQACESGATPIEDLEFNDIANTISASTYAWWNIYRSESGQVEVGPGYRVGIQSREKLTSTGDSINRFHGPGVRWLFNDLLPTGIKNGIPKFEMQYYRMKYEDFLGLDREQRRHLLRAYYRPTDLPVIMGLIVNGGEGPDEISLTLEYGVKVDKLIDAF